SPGSPEQPRTRSARRPCTPWSYRELSARFLAIASTMGADLSEANIRKTIEIARQLSDETKGISEQLRRGKLAASAKGEQDRHDPHSGDEGDEYGLRRRFIGRHPQGAACGRAEDARTHREKASASGGRLRLHTERRG